MPDTAPAPWPDADANPTGLAEVLLRVSLASTLLLRPRYAAGGAAILDFDLAYLNPTAQRLLGPGAHPGASLRGLFPEAGPLEIMAFCRAAFASGQLAHYPGLYQPAGLAGAYALTAQRHAQLLAVSISESEGEARQPLAEALRTSQARELLARQAAEQVQALNAALAATNEQLAGLTQELEDRVQSRTRQLTEQQGLLRHILREVPAAVATLLGPEHRFAFFNDQYNTLTGGRAVLGHTVAEVLPEVVEQGFLALLDQVFASGEPFVGKEIALVLAQAAGPVTHYLDFTYQPLTDGAGRVMGILVFVLDVTERVRARRQTDTLQAAGLAAVRRRAQQRQELYQIFAQAPVAIVLLREPDHRIDYFNPAFEVLFPPEEWRGGALQGHTLAEVYPRVKTAGLLALLDRVYATGEPQVVIEMPLADLQPGSPRYVTFSYQAYREEGRIVGVAAFVYDVTEQVLSRRQADAMQAALLAVAQRRAQERQDLLDLFKQAPVAVALLRGPEHRIEECNEAFAQLYPSPTLRGHTVAEAYPTLASAEIKSRLDRVYTTGETYRGVERPMTTAAVGGPPRYVTFTYQAYREHERIAGVSVFVHDVTEQVLARQQAEAQQAELQTLFEQAPVAIFLLRGPAYVLELVNPLMGEMLGHAPAQLLGQPFFEAVPELVGQGLREVLDEVRRTGTPYAAQEQPIRLARHQGPDPGYFNFVYQPLRGPAGITAVVCVATEVTGQVRSRQQVQRLNEELATINQAMQATNEELHHANARLSRTNADLDTFVYSASHDLKSPITNIEGLLLALRQQLPPAALQAPLVTQLLGLMEGAVGRFQQTLGHLTDVTRLQPDRPEQPAEAVALPALAEALRLDLLPELTAAGATLTLDLGACPVVYFSAKNLRSVLYNLLSNAIKYRDPSRPAVVVLRCRSAEPGQVALEVQDNGLGLSAPQQGELFRLFRRLHHHVPGSGVGLYMVKKIVENAGGTLSVQSQPDVGSTFTVLLPAPTA